MLYFSASRNDKLHCTGVATSDSIEGPYTARADPWACPLDQGGAIDASGFLDSDGSRYVTYKIDVSARAQISLQPRPSSAATINIHADPVSCNRETLSAAVVFAATPRIRSSPRLSCSKRLLATVSTRSVMPTKFSAALLPTVRSSRPPASPSCPTDVTCSFSARTASTRLNTTSPTPSQTVSSHPPTSFSLFSIFGTIRSILTGRFDRIALAA